MKRFITYLYEYENGEKRKSAGFVRVNIREEKVQMEFCVRNYMRESIAAEVYVLVRSEEVMGIRLGEITIGGNLPDGRLMFEKENIAGSGYSFSNIIGIGIRLENKKYLASCWNDNDVHMVRAGEWLDFGEKYEVEKREVVKEDVIKEDVEPELVEEEIQIEETFVLEHSRPDTCVYKKINVEKIRSLPSSNWHLSTNVFLMHGFYNYGYLLLKKEIAQGKEKHWLGVPGFFEKPEYVMAHLFGFTEFEAVPKEVAALKMDEESRCFEKEKNQEPRTGIFGCWFVELTK